MHFLFSGEGPTDLGVCSNGAHFCDGESFLPGPMAMMIDQFVELQHGYSPLDAGVCRFVPEATLVDRAAELKAARKLLALPGKKRGKETRYFFNNARALARIATEQRGQLGDDVVAVLFRDSDGTASAGRGLWPDKLQSMHDGFAEDGFDRGVPMLPRPKSEAWLICALKHEYRNCAQLEQRSGNDHSPDSLKKELEAHLGAIPSREELCEFVEDRRIDCRRIDMESFSRFRDTLLKFI